MKVKTLEQVESMKAKAERFVRDVLDDDDRADEIADESAEDYADRKRIRILANQYQRKNPMPNTKADLEARIEELESQNEELRDKLEAIGEVLAGDEDEDDDEAEDDAEDDE